MNNAAASNSKPKNVRRTGIFAIVEYASVSSQYLMVLNSVIMIHDKYYTKSINIFS